MPKTKPYLSAAIKSMLRDTKELNDLIDARMRPMLDAAAKATTTKNYPFGKVVRGTISGDLAMCIGTASDGDLKILPLTGERVGTIQTVPTTNWRLKT